MKRWLPTFAATSALVLTPVACAKAPNEVVESAVAPPVAEPEIDRDPVALLPSRPIGLSILDAQALFKSEFGPELLGIAEAVLPLPREAGFEPKRDLETVYVGVYSMQGVDVVGVVRGQFDGAAIDRVVDAKTPTPLGPPLTRGSYAGKTVYGVNDAGFVLLTKRTALAGNTTALRRALDRIEEGRVRRELPDWLDTLVKTQGAPVIAAIDLAGNPISDAARREMGFLEGMETVRVLGNFADPGFNLAGSLTYGNEEQAKLGTQRLLERANDLERYSTLLALFGIRNPLVKLEAQPQAKESRFVAGLSGPILKDLLTRARQFLPNPAPTSAAPTPEADGAAAAEATPSTPPVVASSTVPGASK